MKNWINAGDRIIDLSIPKIMGIINATPDSFYEKSRVSSKDALDHLISKMYEEGADMLDVGGYSTRPGALEVSVQEEIDRVLPVIENIRSVAPNIIISIDTFRAEVAKVAVKAGAHIINDVSGGNLDENMFETVVALNVPYILMHMRGTPQTMNNLTQYHNLTKEVLLELQKKCVQLNRLGIKDIIIDPGLGFAKTVRQNYDLLDELDIFKVLELPILIGLSRKSMIWKKLGITQEEALNGTTILNTVALLSGTSILRVHDVRAAVESRKLLMGG